MYNSYLWAIGISIGLIVIIYILYESWAKKRMIQERLPKETVIAILKELKRDSFPLCQNLVMSAMQLKAETEGEIEESELREELLENEGLKEEKKRLANRIYAIYGVTEEDMKYACDSLYRGDKTVDSMLSDVRLSIERAAIGIFPEGKTEIPKFLTQEMAFKLVKRIMRETLIRMQKAIKALKRESKNEEEFEDEVADTIENLGLHELKREILNQAGLDKYEDSAEQIIHTATMKYAKENPEFMARMKTLETRHQNAFDVVIRNPDEAQNLIRAFADD